MIPATAQVTLISMANEVVDQLTKIPAFMRRLGWSVSATLMEKWFSRAANNQPDLGVPDTTTIKMDSWVLHFARAWSVYDAMVRGKVWINPPAQLQLTQILRRKRLIGDGVAKFGYAGVPLPQVRQDEVNFRQVGSSVISDLTDPLDDMFGALGAFNIDCVAQGQVLAPPKPAASAAPKGTPQAPASHTVEIQAVGFFVSDSYNFNDDQPLGFWNFKTGHVSKLPLPGYHWVSNQTFRDYRDKYKKGGDFRVFSDIKTLNLNPPQRFVVNE